MIIYLIIIIIILITTYINIKSNLKCIELFDNKNPYNFIDIIYYINLDYRNDQFLNEISKINFPNNKINRISAIKNNNGAIGCSNISLHFRLGDYKAHNMHILDLSYYINSLELLIQKTNKNNWSVLCFYIKDDIIIINDYLNKLQNKFENINFIHINTSLQEFEQLLIMSLCKHNIIANSTFSWFGGYLNNNKNKIVIYPKIWIGYNYNGNNFNFKDLFIDSWIGI